MTGNYDLENVTKNTTSSTFLVNRTRSSEAMDVAGVIFLVILLGYFLLMLLVCFFRICLAHEIFSMEEEPTMNRRSCASHPEGEIVNALSTIVSFQRFIMHMSAFYKVALTAFHRLQREDAFEPIQIQVNAIVEGRQVQTRMIIYKCATYVTRHFFQENQFRGGIVAMYTTLIVLRSGSENMIPVHAVVDVY